MGSGPQPDPIVSFCIPVYNGAATIAACLSSVVDQEIPGAEILVVDNRSTDGTLREVDNVLAGVPGARVVVNPENIGRVPNWNRCLDLARGRYLKMVMANDVLLRGTVECLLAAADLHADTVLVSSQHAPWDGSPGPVPGVASAPQIESWHGPQTLEYVREGGNPFWTLNGALMLRDAIRKGALAFDDTEPYFADLIFCARLSTLGTTTFIHTPTYRFNRSIRTRFHYVGGQTGAFFLGMRRYRDTVNSLLRQAGRREGDVWPRMYEGLLYRVFDEKAPTTLADLLEAFRGGGWWRLRAALAWLRCRLRLHVAEARLRGVARGAIRRRV